MVLKGLTALRGPVYIWWMGYFWIYKWLFIRCQSSIQWAFQRNFGGHSYLHFCLKGKRAFVGNIQHLRTDTFTNQNVLKLGYLTLHWGKQVGPCQPLLTFILLFFCCRGLSQNTRNKHYYSMESLSEFCCLSVSLTTYSLERSTWVVLLKPFWNISP